MGTIELKYKAEFEHNLSEDDIHGSEGMLVQEKEPSVEELANLEQTVVTEIEDLSDNADYVGSSMNLYLRDIKEYPLLSFEEEQELGRCIEAGGPDAPKAIEKLVIGNLRYVLSYSKRYIGQGVDFEDINSYGIQGLMRAAEKFDYRKGFRFITYATWWIKQAIERGMADMRSGMHIPMYLNEDIRKIKKFRDEFEEENGRMPSTDEISKSTGIKRAKVLKLFKAGETPISLDATVGESGDTSTANFVPSENDDMFDIIVNRELSEVMKTVLSHLEPKERKVLILHYGIGGAERRSLEEIAKLPEFGVSRERIRQIEAKAFRKIRRNSTMNGMLSDFLAS